MLRNLIILCALFMCVNVVGQTKAELEKKKNETLKEIESLNKQYDNIKKTKKESLGQLALIQQKITLRNQVIGDINKQVAFINKDIDSSYREMIRLKKDLDELKKNYAQSVVYAYKNRSNYDFLNFVFSATSFNDAIRRVAYMRAYRDYQSRQLEAIQKTQALYGQKINELKINKDAKTTVLLDQNREMGELMKDKQEKDQVVVNLKKRETQINNMIVAKRKQSKEIEAAIKAVVKREIELAKKEAERKAKEDRDRKAQEEKERLAREAEAKKNGTGTTTVTTTVTKKEEPVKQQQSYLEYNKEDLELGASFESNRGKLPYPIDNGYVAIGFGPYTVPGTKITGSQDFITFASPVGTSVKAVFGGEVVSVFDVGGMFAVMLKHGKYFTTYSNLSSTSVSKGQDVKSGQLIGKVGANLEGDGQLDFILTREAVMLNPQQWLRSR
jgi:septal ring factor EnvC (AmiA/AmiB activator)